MNMFDAQEFWLGMLDGKREGVKIQKGLGVNTD